MTPHVLILTGDGINCEQETAHAFRLAGFQTKISHINDMTQEGYVGEGLLRKTDILALPGGFSFGDDLGSGKVLALKIKNRLQWDLKRFAREGGMVLGVCNGFQALIQLGVFNHLERRRSITHNASGKFTDQWVRLNVQGDRCVWLKGVPSFEAPIRHGEGRLVFESPDAVQLDLKEGYACLRYETDVNGSESQIAGLCDETGRIFGLMPHPEAAVRKTQHPRWLSPEAKEFSVGLKLFKNAAHAAVS